MKTTFVYRTCLLLLAASLSLLSCERNELLSELEGRPSIQAANGNSEGSFFDRDHGGGPCQCGPACYEFTTSMSLTSTPLDFNDVHWDFMVSLRKTGECDPSLTDPSTCRYTGDRYELAFPNNPDLTNYINLSYFQKVHAYDPDGRLIQAYKGSTESAIYIADEADVYFKWNSSHALHPTPSAIELSAGGVCIIGIITDPCPTCPGHGRRIPPMAPHKLRLN